MENKTKPEITLDAFLKCDIRAGTIIECEKLENSDKLLKLTVDFGELGMRTILTGMADFYNPAELVDVQTLFLVNLQPRKIRGAESQGMLLALGLSDDTKPIFLKPATQAPNGEGLR